MTHPPTDTQVRLRADGALLLITVFWGVSFVVVKEALEHADTFSFLALRFSLGALVLTAWVRGQVLKPRNLRHGVILGLFLFTGFVLQTLGLERTTPSRSAFITGLSVVLVPFISLALFKRVPRVASLLGVASASVGLYFLTRVDSELSGQTGISLGDWLTLGSAVAYAFHIILTERYAQKEGAMGLVAVQLWTVAIGATLALPFVHPHVAWSGRFLATVLFCGVFASAMAISVQTWAQARTTAVRAALVYALEPVIAALFSLVLGYEQLGSRELFGGALIVVGVLVAELGGVLWQRLRAAHA